jgi:hypothetical protein
MYRKTHKKENECPTCDTTGKIQTTVNLQTGNTVPDKVINTLKCNDFLMDIKYVEKIVHADLLLASSNGAMDRDKLYVDTYKAYMSGSVADELVDLIFIANTAAKMLGINIDDAQAAKHLYNLRRKD